MYKCDYCNILSRSSECPHCGTPLSSINYRKDALGGVAETIFCGLNTLTDIQGILLLLAIVSSYLALALCMGWIG